MLAKHGERNKPLLRDHNTIHALVIISNLNNLLKVGGAALDVYSSEPPHKDEVIT